jgi:hypothetical protein
MEQGRRARVRGVRWRRVVVRRTVLVMMATALAMGLTIVWPVRPTHRGPYGPLKGPNARWEWRQCACAPWGEAYLVRPGGWVPVMGGIPLLAWPGELPSSVHAVVDVFVRSHADDEFVVVSTGWPVRWVDALFRIEQPLHRTYRIGSADAMSVRWMPVVGSWLGVVLCVSAVWAWSPMIREMVRAQRGCCAWCGYSLVGIAGDAVCPECGEGREGKRGT